MKILSTKWHGILDYVLAVLMIVSPWALNFAENGMQLWVPVILGFLIILYSLMTTYEAGLSDNIGIKTHLVIDMCAGILLAISPWIFDFADIVFIPHTVLGGAFIVSALLTYTTVGERRKLNARMPAITVPPRSQAASV